MTRPSLPEAQKAACAALAERHPGLADFLRALWRAEPIWPQRPALRDFASKALAVRPEDYESWYRLAWWGMHAGIRIRQRLFEGRAAEVLNLVDDPAPGIGTVQAALAAGRGAVVLIAHLGLGYVPPHALRQAGLSVKAIAFSRTPMRAAHADDYIFVATPEERAVSLVRALKHLRHGGVLVVAPTGQEGRAVATAPFLGHRLNIFPGLAEIARLSGAPLVWSSGTWAGPARIRLRFETLPEADPAPPGSPDGIHAAYLARLARQMRGQPADLGFIGGFWHALPWYAKQARGP